MGNFGLRENRTDFRLKPDGILTPPFLASEGQRRKGDGPPPILPADGPGRPSELISAGRGTLLPCEPEKGSQCQDRAGRFSHFGVRCWVNFKSESLFPRRRPWEAI